MRIWTSKSIAMQFLKFKETKIFLTEILEREPTPKELEQVSKLKMNDILVWNRWEKILDQEEESMGQDAFEYVDPKITIEKIGSDHLREFFEINLSPKLEEILKTLPPKESELIRKRYGIGGNRELSISEISKLWKVSPQYLHQILPKIERKLKQRGIKSN